MNENTTQISIIMNMSVIWEISIDIASMLTP